MKLSSLILWAIIFLGSIYHIAFFHLNEILKVADSFAYLQMSSYIKEFSQAGLWSGWFGFVYSIPLALSTSLIENEILAVQIVNLLLFALSAVLLWKISRKILSENFSYLVIILFYLSPTLLHFNIHILSENIYIPLFLGLFLAVSKFWDISKHISSPSLKIHKQKKQVITIACLIGLMYLTRAEAFIYLGSIGIISIILLYKKYLSFWDFFKLWALFFITFFVFISPYLFHLHSLTWEWWLTNKWASNLRQAELRGRERMDDAWFEQAVAELTDDNTQLIAGFAGGMEYTKPQIEWSLWAFILADPRAFISRVLQNQIKLFTKNIPEIFLGKSPNLYYSTDSRFTNIFFLMFCIIPLFILLYGIYQLYKKEKEFLWNIGAFFIPACLFFTLFFILNRYFLIFLPFLLITFVYGIYSLKNLWNNIMWSTLISYFLTWNIVSIFLLSTSVYYNIESPKDEYYTLKQEAGIWLRKNKNMELKIMERFPIVTYYADSKTRYITPYSDDIQNIYEYGIYNNIDILVADTMDFKNYRPWLTKYIEQTPENFSLLKKFENDKWQKVILYTLKK